MSTSFFDDDDDGDDTQPRDREFSLPPPLRAPAARQSEAPRQAARHARSVSRPMELDDLSDDDRPNGNGAQHHRSTTARGYDDDELELLDDSATKIEEEEDEREKETEIQQLMRYWMDERMAPELLRSKEDLVNRILERLDAQTEAAALLSESAAGNASDHERILLVQSEIERVKYLVRSYVRVRTWKIETFAQYLLKTPGCRKKMSSVEWGYCERYRELITTHLSQAVIQNLPDRLGRLDEEEMILKPDLDASVFAKARRTCPTILLPDGQTLDMQKGDTHMLRYRSVRRLVQDGDVRLV